MPIKNVLVQVGANEESRTTVIAAHSVARTFDAGLTGFFVVPDVALAAATPGDAALSPQLVEELQKRAENDAAEAKKIFDEATQGPGIALKWECVESRGTGVRAAAASHAHYADLIVAGARRSDRDLDDNAGTVYPEDLVIDAGRPLFLVPPATGVDLTTMNALVAWSESREAARAVFDALPMLRKADTVNVVTVVEDDGKGVPPGDRITGVLKDHGVNATAETVIAESGQSTSEALFAHAVRSGADILVAGAYSHSRLREGLFGGVTKSIFESAPLPALLSH